MTSADPTSPAEDRLRARLARYGATLDAAASEPAPARPRHLVAVDGPAPGSPGSPGSPRGLPLARVAAAVLVVAVVAGAGWAATRPVAPGGPATTTRAGWADDDLVRPQDRRTAFAALDGAWVLPDGTSLAHVVDRRTEERPTFAAYRSELAEAASCLWFRTAYEGDLAAADRSTVEAMPSWPGHTGGPAVDRRALDAAVEAALADDREALRGHLAARCGGSGAALGLPELGAYWLVAGEAGGGGTEIRGETAQAVDPARIPGWDAIAERLGPQIQVEEVLALSDGGYHVALAGRGVTSSLTLARVDGPVAVPVADDAFAAGSEVRDGGLEVFAGEVDGDAVALAVGPGGTSVTLSFRSSAESTTDRLGDLADLAADLHAAAWPR